MIFGVYAAQEIQQQVSTNTSGTPVTSSLISDKRGYVALLYSGTARSFSVNFESHIVNLMAGCPYTVHLFFHTYTNKNRSLQYANDSNHANYLSVNSTLAYYEGYINLDNESVLFRDAVKANVFEYMPIENLREIYKDTYDIATKRFTGHPPIQSIYYMWHSQRRSEELRQQYMNTTGCVYKWTFRMRHDAVYFTNWWQQAFNVLIYNPMNPIHKKISHDISSDWGVQRTRLFDMVYEPKLQMNNALYTPLGWKNGGYNDQFAAMSSMNANHYFTRILHVNRMLREEKVHPETSIRLIAKWNNITVNEIDGTICYDIVRTFASNQQIVDSKGRKRKYYSYKGSGKEDCAALCPRLEKINKALRNSFIYDASFLDQDVTLNNKEIEALLIHHISRIDDGTVLIGHLSSSFYYFYRTAASKNGNDPCLPNTWTKDQSNNYRMHNLPFILRTSDRKKIAMYNKHLTCGHRRRSHEAWVGSNKGLPRLDLM
jgi:hypothetical protein